MHHNDQVSLCVWRTPERILAPVREVLGPFTDVATDSTNPTGAARFLTEKEDGLETDWGDGPVFCNPPWGKKRPIWWWAALAWQWTEDNPDRQLIFVSPAATNAQWFHRYLRPAQAHCFPKGRIAFEMPPGFANDSSPTFDTCITYFGRHGDVFKRAFADVGWCP